jgi:hypothetical protein
MSGRMVVSRQLLVYKEKMHARAICLVKEGKVEGIVVVDDLEGEAVPEWPVQLAFYDLVAHLGLMG